MQPDANPPPPPPSNPPSAAPRQSGQEASAALQKKIGSNPVECMVRNEDLYGRSGVVPMTFHAHWEFSASRPRHVAGG